MEWMVDHEEEKCEVCEYYKLQHTLSSLKTATADFAVKASKWICIIKKKIGCWIGFLWVFYCIASTVTFLASKAITAINQRTQQQSSSSSSSTNNNDNGNDNNDEEDHTPLNINANNDHFSSSSSSATLLSSINKETLTDLGERGKTLFSKAISWTRAKSTSLMEEVQKKTTQPSSTSTSTTTNNPTTFGIAEIGKKMMKAWAGEEPSVHEEKIDQPVDQSLFTVDE